MPARYMSGQLARSFERHEWMPTREDRSRAWTRGRRPSQRRCDSSAVADRLSTSAPRHPGGRSDPQESTPIDAMDELRAAHARERSPACAFESARNVPRRCRRAVARSEAVNSASERRAPKGPPMRTRPSRPEIDCGVQRAESGRHGLPQERFRQPRPPGDWRSSPAAVSRSHRMASAQSSGVMAG